MIFPLVGRQSTTTTGQSGRGFAALRFHREILCSETCGNRFVIAVGRRTVGVAFPCECTTPGAADDLVEIELFRVHVLGVFRN
jgi:hypothetical protein